MQESINTIKRLHEILRKRSIELEELIMELEERTCGMDEESEEAQELIHETGLAYQELRLNDRYIKELSLCDWCKLSDHNLCEVCG